jgi:hypothetical protein
MCGIHHVIANSASVAFCPEHGVSKTLHIISLNYVYLYTFFSYRTTL